MSNELVTLEKPMTPLDLLAKLTDGNAAVNPDVLEKLLDMQEKWTKARAVEAYNAAMAKCQAEMPVVVHDAVNNETKRGYATFENVQHAAKKIYSSNGFSLSFATEACAREGFYNVTCDCMHMQGDSRRHVLHSVPIDDKGAKGNPNKTAIQGMMSSMSYAEKRLLCMIFNITIAGEDLDGRDDDGEVLDEKQVETIKALLAEKGYLEPAFFKWCKNGINVAVEKYDDIPAKKFDSLVKQMKTWTPATKGAKP